MPFRAASNILYKANRRAFVTMHQTLVEGKYSSLTVTPYVVNYIYWVMGWKKNIVHPKLNHTITRDL